jgi:anthranilate phosphoribosyltransferase
MDHAPLCRRKLWLKAPSNILLPFRNSMQGAARIIGVF